MNNSTDPSDDGLAGVSDVGSAYFNMRIISIVLGILGTLGNGFVLVIIFGFTKMTKKLGNYFIINQSAVDLWASLMTTLIYATKGVSYSGLSLDGQNIACKLWFSTVPLWGSLTASTYNLVFLTLERYFIVVHPIWHKTKFTKTKAWVAMVLVWVGGLAWPSVTLIPTTAIIGDACVLGAKWPNLETQRLYGALNVAVLFFVPVGIQLYSYGRILHVLRKRTEQMNPSSTLHSNSGRAQRNIIKTCILLSLCYVLCWTLNQMVYLVYQCGVAIDFSSWFYHFSVILVFVNSCVNPIIYVYKYGEFQAGLRRAFCKTRVDPMNSSVTQTSAQLGSVESRQGT